jgi:hypothetical protein
MGLRLCSSFICLIYRLAIRWGNDSRCLAAVVLYAFQLFYAHREDTGRYATRLLAVSVPAVYARGINEDLRGMSNHCTRRDEALGNILDVLPTSKLAGFTPTPFASSKDQPIGSISSVVDT